MNVIVLGSGGREHALCYKISQSKLIGKLFAAPGNPGIAEVAENVALNPNDFPAIEKFCEENHITLIVVGPEDPLVNGVSDYFQHHKSIKVFGPNKTGAQLEGSKDFSKEFMLKYGIPTARYKTFTANQLSDAKTYIQSHSLPIVLKADGLAAGKGVLICESHQDALNEIEAMLQHQKFGAASSKVVIESFLKGIELSMFVVTDGKEYVLLPEAKDYKRIGEGDTGLNTGGMGSISPVPFADEAFKKKVEEQVIKPTLKGLQQEGIEYIGFIFFGLMNINGEPWVIEYNCRMGDPETQSVFSRIDSDVLDLLNKACEKQLSNYQISISNQKAASVILVSGGYPESYEKGFEISGIDTVTDSKVFHAGTSLKDGKLVNTGGRVLAITSLHQDGKKALENSLKNAEKISYTGKYYRRDIGFDLSL
jgi:phosphoribosylamine---glycine ligase